MKSAKVLQSLAEGKTPKQTVTYIVKAHGNIVPTVIMNVYLNLESIFIAMQPSFDRPTKTSIISNGKPPEPIPIMNYIFTTSLENYVNTFGDDYKPSNILKFFTLFFRTTKKFI